MDTDLANSEVWRQAKTSPVANGLVHGGFRPWPMPKRGRRIFKRPNRKLYIGPWLRRLGRKQVEMAKHLKITESYASELVNDPKINPSPVLLLELSEWLGISVNDLYRMPPEAKAIESIGNLSPATIDRLRAEAKTRDPK